MPVPRGKKPPTPKPPTTGGRVTIQPVRGPMPPVKAKKAQGPARRRYV